MAENMQAEIIERIKPFRTVTRQFELRRLRAKLPELTDGQMRSDCYKAIAELFANEKTRQSLLNRPNFERNGIATRFLLENGDNVA